MPERTQPRQSLWFARAFCAVLLCLLLSSHASAALAEDSPTDDTTSSDEADTPTPEQLALKIAESIGFTNVDEVCDAAEAMAEDDPENALKLVDRVRAPAFALLAAGIPLTDDIASLLQECENARVAALNELGKADEESPAEEYSSTWTDAVAAWLKPLAPQGVVYLAVLGGLLVLARLLVFLPSNATVAKPSKSQRRGWLLLGLLKMVLSPVVLIAAVSVLQPHPKLAWDFQLFAIALGIMAIVLALGIHGSFSLSRFLATQLRLSLRFNGDDGESSEARTSELITRLTEMAGSPPRGMEIPSATDVSALTDAAIPGVSENKVLAGIQAVFKAIFGVVPWHIMVDPVDKTSVSVVINRNGHAVKAVTVDIAALKVPSDAEKNNVYLSRLVAAVVVVELSDKHIEFKGLFGARDWRSLGLQSIASADFLADDEEAVRFLSAAVGYDSGNRMADLALQNRLHRKSLDLDELKQYAVWLSRKVDDLADPYPDLQLRAWRGFTAVSRNALAVAANTDPPASWSGEPSYAEMLERAQGLVTRLEDSPPDGLERVYEQMQPMAATDLRQILARGPNGLPNASPPGSLTDQWYKEALNSPAPTVAYGVACQLALGATTVDGILKERLERGLLHPLAKEWSLKDPELEAIRDNRVFRQIAGPLAPTDVWSLEPLAAKRDLLKKYGISLTAELAESGADEELRAMLQLSVVGFARMIGIAKFVEASNRVAGEPMKPYAVTAIGTLLELGAYAPEDLSSEWVEHHKAAVFDAVREVYSETGEQATQRQVTTWLNALTSPPE